MALENLPNNAKELYENIQDLVKSNIEYYKLDLFEKSAKGTINLIKIVMLSSVFFFLLLFLSTAVAFWIGEEIDSVSGGFFIVAGIYLILLIAAYFFSKTSLEGIVLEKLSHKFFKEKKEDENL